MIAELPSLDPIEAIDASIDVVDAFIGAADGFINRVDATGRNQG